MVSKFFNLIAGDNYKLQVCPARLLQGCIAAATASSKSASQGARPGVRASAQRWCSGLAKVFRQHSSVALCCGRVQRDEDQLLCSSWREDASMASSLLSMYTAAFFSSSCMATSAIRKSCCGRLLSSIVDCRHELLHVVMSSASGAEQDKSV